MTLTARQLRQPPTIKAIERVPYFANVSTAFVSSKSKDIILLEVGSCLISFIGSSTKLLNIVI